MNSTLFNFIFKTKQLFHNRNLLHELAQTRKNLYADRFFLEDMQLIKFKSIFEYAYNSSPFYSSKYKESNIHPSEIKTLHDIYKVPFITKTEIRENIDQILLPTLDSKLKIPVNTGGTTGVPMKLYWDKRKANLMNALYFRTIEMNGCGIGSKTAWIWGLKKEDEYMDFRNQNQFKRWLKNTTWLNGFDMTPNSMSEFSIFSFKYKPELIIGYVSSLFEFAKFIIDNNIKIYPPKTIWITAEPSTREQRELIERAFKAPTFSQYGCSEILHLATECYKHEGMHIHADSRLIEITDENGYPIPDGESGYLVLTDLENYVTPLIRYKNDDMGSKKKEPCSCGITFPMLEKVDGRVYNVFKLKSGKQIYGHMFSRIFFNYVEEIQQFQIHQTSIEHINVYIVPGKIKDRTALQTKLLDAMCYHTKFEINYQFHWVKNIQKEKSGKLLYTKSDV